MKNKLSFPIALLSIIIIIESMIILSKNNLRKSEVENKLNIVPSEETKEAEVLNFEWLHEKGKATLIMTPKRTVAIDAIDLYVAYKGVIVNSVKNLGELPEPSFSKVSIEKSLVVMNYLIAETNGFNIEEGQSIRVAQLDIKLDPAKIAELSIDPKTQVVENGTVKVLPFNSKSLIVNSASL